MRKLSGMIEDHLPGILAHWKSGVTNAFMEALNSVFSATKRKARGYRSATHISSPCSTSSQANSGYRNSNSIVEGSRGSAGTPRPTLDSRTRRTCSRLWSLKR